MKSKSAAILFSSLLFVSALSGCESSSDKASSKPEKAEKLTSLSYFVTNNRPDTLKNYNEIGAYKKLEEKTGIKVDFKHPASQDTQQQFNLMMTSGELPDVIEWVWTGVPGGPQKYIKEKKIIKLNDYIDKYAPNLKKVLAEHPEWKKQIQTDDGSIYAFPFLRGDSSLLTFYGPMLRKDWLDKLGLQTPETIDEWHTTLKAFKEKDPNGNGEKDEIPLLINKTELTSNAFAGAYGITPGFYQEDGKVKYGSITPGFKKYLTLLHDWYKEGLIDSDYVSTDEKLTDAKVTNNQAGSFMGYAGSTLLRYTQLMKDKNSGFELTGAKYPVLKKGEMPEWGQKDFNYTGVSAAISTSNKNVAETVKWLDYKYGEEGHMLFNFGIEGESYTMENDYPTYTKEITKNPDGLPMANALSKFVPVGWSGPFVQDKRYLEQYMQIPQQKDAISKWEEASNKKQLPLVTPTSDESTELASIMNDIGTYKSEMVNKFIMGQEPLSKFDEYVETIKSMGIDRAIEIEQAALERYNKR